MNRTMTSAVCAALLAVGAAAHAQSPAMKGADGTLTDSKGMTLYVFDKDAAGSGKSACNGPCAALWPPLTAAGDAKPAGEWTVVTRDDGARQWAYKGKPVYLWSKDAKAGDRTGDNFNGVWHVVKD